MNKLLPGALQLIYFDPFHEKWDGCGWNVVDADKDTGVALRLETLEQCIKWCETNGFPFMLESARDA